MLGQLDRILRASSGWFCTSSLISPSTAFRSLTMSSLFLASSVCCRAHDASDSCRSASRLLFGVRKYLQEAHTVVAVRLH